MANNASHDANEVDEIIANALSSHGNPIPFLEAKKLLGDILKVTIQPLLSKSEKDKKIDTLIHKAIESLNLDKE